MILTTTTYVYRYLLNEFCPPAGVTVTPPTMASRRLLDINDKNSSGATPLELAAQHGHMPVVRLLLDHGAVTTLPDSNNQLLSCNMFCGIQFLLENRRREQLDRYVRGQLVRYVRGQLDRYVVRVS